MPNAIAYLAIIVWPLIAARIHKKFSLADAAILIFLVPYLLLPAKTGIDLPLLPEINKELIASLAALFLLRKPLAQAGGIKLSKSIKLCLVALFGGLFMTVLQNGDPLIFNSGALPGLRTWDYIGLAFSQFFGIFIPFLVGYRLLSRPQDYERIIYWLALWGLIYLPAMLWEVRMSPQLHTQLYGFFPHSFAQQVRDGGFRPVVFLGHGLLVAFFAFSACVCTYAWMKTHPKLWRIPSKVVLVALLVGLVLCKTMSVLIYLFFCLAMLMLFSASKRYWLMLFIALSVLAYPALREAATPSLDAFASKIQEINPDRAQSLRFRLNNEEALLEKAHERKWFGWGSWGRNHIYNSDGKMLSVTDGVWIIFYGLRGWVGYIGFMWLLVLPFWLHWRQRKTAKLESTPELHVTALMLVLLCNLIDFVPNSSLSHVTLLLAGALSGGAIRRASALENKR